VETFGSADFGSILDVLESKLVALAKLGVFTTTDFCESFEACAISSVISTILGLGAILGLETFWVELEFCLFSLRRICRTFAVGASTVFVFCV